MPLLNIKALTFDQSKHILGIFLFAMTLLLGITCISIALFLLNTRSVETTYGLLYPRESETRDVKSLDGVWYFMKSANSSSRKNADNWHLQELKFFGDPIQMPVPASYNDISTDRSLRDHVGSVWYERKFFVSSHWSENNQRIWLRFGSVHYYAIVFVNGNEVTRHEIGHLPFEVEITKHVQHGIENRLTVMCDNTISGNSIPQGSLYNSETDNGVESRNSYTFDFFNYAGIHRSVHLYTTPRVYIQDVHVKTTMAKNNQGGVLYFSVVVSGQNSGEAASDLLLHVKLRNKQDELVGVSTPQYGVFSGSITVSPVYPWWPYLMHPNPGYMYEMEIDLFDKSPETLLDIYRMKVGFRTLSWNSDGMTINGKPLYLRGFGKHEDADVRGKGLDLSIMTRDFHLMKWIGANSYRTTHYPYSEESMQMADEQGIMIIDECPSVDTTNFNPKLLENHKSALEQLVHRDRNHPSVIMWSLANEPSTNSIKASTYFGCLADFTRKLDLTRPITIAISTPPRDEQVAKYLDIICFNRYNGWYSNAGRLNKITKAVISEALDWREKHNKPVLISEYGADTVEGLHLLPSYIWSEEYQVDLLSRHFRAFDDLRENNQWFMGEMVWNFADFKTDQSYKRVGGNKKGVFTRNRQPKSSAHLLRRRYFALSQEIDQYQLVPNDLYVYVTNSTSMDTMPKISKYMFDDTASLRQNADDSSNL